MSRKTVEIILYGKNTSIDVFCDAHCYEPEPGACYEGYFGGGQVISVKNMAGFRKLDPYDIGEKAAGNLIASRSRRKTTEAA